MNLRSCDHLCGGGHVIVPMAYLKGLNDVPALAMWYNSWSTYHQTAWHKDGQRHKTPRYGVLMDKWIHQKDERWIDIEELDIKMVQQLVHLHVQQFHVSVHLYIELCDDRWTSCCTSALGCTAGFIKYENSNLRAFVMKLADCCFRTLRSLLCSQKSRPPR